MWECRGFADLLPSVVEVEHVHGDPGDTPWPGEAPVNALAIGSRRAEFATTRACARRALARLGHAPQAIPVGADREPVWPAGIVGSLTHGAGLRAAAVAPATLLRSVGIDVEPNTSLPHDTVRSIANAGEVSRLEILDSSWPELAWDRMLFSAKEAIFKAWFPLTGRWLAFTDCDLAIDPDTATFRGHLNPRCNSRVEHGVDEISGRWGIYEGRVLTTVALPSS